MRSARGDMRERRERERERWRGKNKKKKKDRKKREIRKRVKVEMKRLNCIFQKVKENLRHSQLLQQNLSSLYSCSFISDSGDGDPNETFYNIEVTRTLLNHLSLP